MPKIFASLETRTLTTLFILTSIFWLAFVIASNYSATYEGPLFDLLVKPFLIGMMTLPLVGGALGLRKSLKWGGHTSKVGLAIIYISLGIISWGIGMIVWNYYLFFTTIEVPYPSLADPFFILAVPLWVFGILELSIVAGVKYGLRSLHGKALLLVIPVIVTLLSYYLLFSVARNGVVDIQGGYLKFLIDIYYPMGDVVILTLTSAAFILSQKFLGGRYKRSIILLFLGFVLMYLSDFIFSYTTTVETYFNGHIVDYLFTATMFILGVGINNLDT